MWSLATETASGTKNGTETLPGTIDAAYTTGFVWTRQYGFRVSQRIGKGFWLAASAENAETLNPGGTNTLNTGTTVLLGSAGVSGGLYKPHGKLLVQLHAGLHREGRVRAGLGPLGSVRHRAQLPGPASTSRVLRRTTTPKLVRVSAAASARRWPTRS